MKGAEATICCGSNFASKIMSGIKTKSGGRRKGAGRKPSGNVRIVLWVKPRTAKRLREQRKLLDSLVKNGVL
jgi:hypothetical protein